MARRGKTPPYELMRSATRPTGGGDAPSPQPAAGASGTDAGDSDAGVGAADSARAAVGGGWAALAVPMVLRVPRGVAVVIAIGLIGLVVLAYWAGHQRGDAAGAERMRAELTESPTATGREAPSPPPEAVAGTEGGAIGEGQAAGSVSVGAGRAEDGTSEPGATAATGAATEAAAGGQGGVYEAGAADDPREPGLNYMIVATYDPPNARELAEFLAGEHGLETVLRPVNNGRRIQVWVVDQGFTGQELGREAYLAYRAELREVGRAWRQHQPALRDALEQMYPTRYDP